jgi:hypothetical protein
MLSHDGGYPLRFKRAGYYREYLKCDKTPCTACYDKLFATDVVANRSHLCRPYPSVLLRGRYHVFGRYCQVSSRDALKIHTYSRDTQSLGMVQENAGKKLNHSRCNNKRVLNQGLG